MTRAQHFVKMLLHPIVATAGSGFERRRVEDQDGATACREDPPRLEHLDDAAGIAAGHAEHAGKLLVGEGDLGAADVLLRGDDPLGGALLDRMRGIAGRGLEQLRELAVAIAREDLLERDRPLLACSSARSGSRTRAPPSFTTMRE